MKASQKVARDALILQRSLRGEKHSAIAADVELSIQQVGKIVREQGQLGQSLVETGPTELIQKWLSGNEASALFYQAIADESGEDPVRISAMRARDDVSAKTMKALSQLHLLPRHLGTLRNIVDFQRLAGQIVEKLEAVERGELSAEAAVAEFRQYGRLGEPDGPTVLPSGEVVVDVESEDEPKGKG